MASTPPPVSMRAHTPPTPLHGPLHDTYEPYSPRRSKRTTAQANPYGSSHSERPPKAHLQRATTPPPTTSKKARFLSTQLSSPPSSPASPARRTTQYHKTPRKTPISRAFADLLSDSDNTPRRQFPTPLPELSMLPTPSKTPKKRNSSAMNSTARILNFQPYSPNDVMPSPRKMKKSSHNRGQSAQGFNLFEEGTSGSQEQIEIYTDANARIPEVDGSADNPFVGPRKVQTSKPSRRARTDEEEEMEQRAERDEGMVYTFRGKKIFRRFNDTDDDAPEEAASPESNPHQRSLKRQAGHAAERRLTRSSIKPRLLFPNDDQIRERQPPIEDEVDEEALTDIEVPAPTPRKSKIATPNKATPSRFSHLATPPSTKRTKRVIDRVPDAASLDVVVEETEEMPKSPIARKAGKVKNRSPFDDWPRSKSSSSSKASRKRQASEPLEPVPGSSKRTRSGVIASPA